MIGAAKGLKIEPNRAQGDHIDNLERVSPSDTVNVEVNADFDSCFRLLIAG